MADPIRVATYNTELSRKGPGLLLRDLSRGTDAQINAVVQVIKQGKADVLAIQDFDYDLTSAALTEFAKATGYPFFFAKRPNTGLATGIDMDNDGRLGTPRDAQGYGTFSGQGGMAILSKFPIDVENVQDFSALLWQDVPNPSLPTLNGASFLSPEALAVQRLSTTGHWIVPILAPKGRFNLMVFHATPPVFDGPEDRNGKRNHDEVRFWRDYLDGAFGTPSSAPFIIAGDANLDPDAGDGRRTAIISLLADPRIQDAAPTGHSPTKATDTVDWSEPTPGDMRVDYVLPSSHWHILNSAVLWPLQQDAFAQTVETASRHRLVWVEVDLK